MSVDLLGQAQLMHDSSDEQIFIRDPFSCTLYDFISFSLNELSKALLKIVTYTHEHLIIAKQKKYFFLIGYKPRQGWSTLQQKIYGDPKIVPEGMDIKWQLKNLRWHYKKYSHYLQLDKETFDDLTGFLLFDVAMNSLTHGKVEEEDDCLASDCLNATIDLLSAAVESETYQLIKDEINKIKENVETMLPIVLEFKSLISKQCSKIDLDTLKVFDFLKSKCLLSALEKEKMIVSNNPTEKPLTNYFLYTVMPRFESLNLTGDSGVVADMSTEVIDGSMIIIGTPATTKHTQSTPFIKNKTVERVKRGSKNSPSRKRKKTPVKSYSQKKLNQSKSPDDMDGSFVLI